MASIVLSSSNQTKQITATCRTCAVEFSSKTKLFQHLKTKQPDGSLSPCNRLAEANGIVLIDHKNITSNEKVLIFVGWIQRTSMFTKLLSKYVNIKEIANTNCAIDPSLSKSYAAAIDCFVVPQSSLLCPPCTVLNQTDPEQKSHVFGISPPVASYYNLRKRCYRREVSILIPITAILPTNTLTNPEKVARDMMKRQHLRDFKQKVHRQRKQGIQKDSQKEKEEQNQIRLLEQAMKNESTQESINIFKKLTKQNV